MCKEGRKHAGELGLRPALTVSPRQKLLGSGIQQTGLFDLSSIGSTVVREPAEFHH